MEGSKLLTVPYSLDQSTLHARSALAHLIIGPCTSNTPTCSGVSPSIMPSHNLIHCQSCPTIVSVTQSPTRSVLIAVLAIHSLTTGNPAHPTLFIHSLVHPLSHPQSLAHQQFHSIHPHPRSQLSSTK